MTISVQTFTLFMRCVMYALSVCVLCSTATARSNPSIVIVQSRELEPYAQATKAICDTYHDSHIEAYTLGDTEKDRSAIIEKLNNESTEMIFTVGSEAFDCFRAVLPSVPHISSMVYDVEGALNNNEYVATLKVPFHTQMQRIQRILPDVASVTVLYMPKSEAAVKEIRRAAQDVGMRTDPILVNSVSDMKDAFDDLSDGTECLLMLLDSELYTPVVFEKIVMISVKKQFPVIAFSPNYVKAGALLSLSATYHNNGRQAALMGKRLFAGDRIQEHVIHSPDVHVVFNTTVAEMMNIQVSKKMETYIDEFVA